MNIQNHYHSVSCTTLIVSIFQFASSTLQFGAKKLGPRKRIWILMSGPPVENRNTFVSQKRMQKYCFFLIWPNIFEKKCKKKCIFSVTCWKSALFILAIFCLIFRFLAQSREFAGFASRTYMRYANYKERAHTRI